MTGSLPSIRRSNRILCGIIALGLMLPPIEAAPVRKHDKERDYKQTYDQIKSIDAAAHKVTIVTMAKEVNEDPNWQHKNTPPPKKGQTNTGARKSPHALSSVTLTVNEFTEIQVNGQKSNLNALRPGMRVDVTRGMDDTTAGRLVVGR